MPRLLRIALLLSALSLTLAGCSSSSSSGGSIQGGGNGSGDAAPGDSQGSGSGGGGGLAGGAPSSSAPAPTGTPGSSPSGGSLGAYDPVAAPLRCMRRKHVHAYRDGGNVIQVAPKATGPRVVFTSTQGDAQAAQIRGQAEGAEVIGPALLYVRDSSDGLIKVMEKCLDAGGTR